MAASITAGSYLHHRWVMKQAKGIELEKLFCFTVQTFFLQAHVL